MRKLVAVVLVVVGLLEIGQVISLIAASSGTGLLQQSGRAASGSAIPFSVVAIVLGLVFAAALIIGRDAISARLFPDEALDIGIDAPMLLRVGLLFIGLGLAVNGLVGTVIGAINAIGQQTGPLGGGAPPGFWILGLGNVVDGLVRLVSGLGIIAVARPLAKWLTGQVPAAAIKPTSLRACPECGASYDPADYRDGSQPRCVECHAPLDVTGGA